MTEDLERRIVLVRHGETVGESSIRFHGSTDVALSDVGRRQIGALADRLCDDVFHAVVHSPLARARESAEILCAALAFTPEAVEAEPAFREVDFGANEGLTAEEIAAARPDWFARWRAGEVDRYPDGESIEGFRRRVAAGFHDACARHPRGDLLLVVHKGVVKAVLAACLAWTEESLRRFPVELGGTTVLRQSGSRFDLGGAAGVPARRRDAGRPATDP